MVLDLEIYYDGKRVDRIVKEGMYHIAYFTDGTNISRYALCQKICQIRCPICQEIRDTKCLKDILQRNKCICRRCSYQVYPPGFLGKKLSQEAKNKISNAARKRSMEGKHPWVGKKHSEETKKKISESKIGKQTCQNNPFYGKKHNRITKKILSDKAIQRNIKGVRNPFYGKHHSEKTKETLSKIHTGKQTGIDNPFYNKTHTTESKEKIKESNRKFRENNPEAWEKQKRNITEALLKRINSGKFTISSIERKTKEYLTGLDIQHKYNFILDSKYQYDFLIENRIVLEVHGDYWHANPNIYGSNKKPLNDRQKFKVERDIIKKAYAESKGYIYYFIWETDIRQNNWSKLEEIIKNERITTNI